MSSLWFNIFFIHLFKIPDSYDSYNELNNIKYKFVLKYYNKCRYIYLLALKKFLNLVKVQENIFLCFYCAIQKELCQ